MNRPHRVRTLSFDAFNAILSQVEIEDGKGTSAQPRDIWQMCTMIATQLSDTSEQSYRKIILELYKQDLSFERTARALCKRCHRCML